MAGGKLFYVIGPSGSGKDALMTYAREQVAGRLPILFAHRYITRPMDAGGENHVCLTQSEFLNRRELGLFALDWQSHQNFYGIGIEITSWMSTGANVVVNGSRKYLPTASQRFPEMRIILIDVSPDVLRQRLTDRGRETTEEINARIERNQQIPPVHHPNLLILNNDASLVESGARFIDMLTS
ncbi:phosphonate metabolism protein/1,5-bisphosphokinase (PRPP-forming) PhnN [Spirosoma aureum]|uniref:Ribose 1,5-bisphosphate phosphokinase PhnN n=1 Tax=Spirosoma aureum TaxID=2692134 RepID=A0A6G9AYB9_9BACT|nr:phosphonate metabolism protein/1,5-bisphosphokinase (PRPP-forming) PhnN [Spirosoma aureum]QIP17384.1 phosphonate metabolism protein/1,5-bisphosphokinase (PRPP-forming) PhnN [Spirosoma aureum]